MDRDVLVVYFHIANSLFKRISSRFYLPVQEMIQLTKEIFEGDHSTEFSSVDRMDIINLAGIHKYNALTVFQRVIFDPFRYILAFKCRRQNWDHVNSPLNRKTFLFMPIKKHHRQRQKRKDRIKRTAGQNLNADLLYIFNLRLRNHRGKRTPIILNNATIGSNFYPFGFRLCQTGVSKHLHVFILVPQHANINPDML